MILQDLPGVTRCPVRLIDALTLRAAINAGEPDATFAAIAALGHSIEAKDLPKKLRGQTWVDYGETVLNWALAHGFKEDEIRVMASEAVKVMPNSDVSQERAEELGSFFR